MRELQSKQKDLFNADTRFIMVLNSIISSGEAAELGSNAILVYLILKCNSDFITSRSSLGVRRICELSGINSQQAVLNAIRKLEEKELIKRCDGNLAGKRAVYEIRDNVHIYDERGNSAGKAVVPYSPSRMKQQLDEVKEALKTGTLPKSSNITLNITIIQNKDNATVNINNQSAGSSQSVNLDSLPVEMADFFKRMMARQPE